MRASTHHSVSRRLELLRKFADPAWEPFTEEYTDHLAGLMKVIEGVGEKLEGNTFFAHRQEDYSELSPRFLNKRRTLALAANVFTDIVEIGFNAGHSAMLMLTANPNLRLTCIDICSHRYTVPCFEYLHSIFGDRITLIEGNSLLAMPLLKAQGKEYGLYIIDGGHGVDVADSDIHNIIHCSKPGSIIMFDDSDAPQLRILLDMYMMSGDLISIADQAGILKNTNQMFFMNNRKG
jgi:predicted O-methyltransferase YrrM